MSKHHERRHKANPKSRVTYVDLLRDAAYALRNAKELSIEVGSHDSIDKAKQHGWPIVWDLTGHCYVYTPCDDGILHMDAIDNHNPTELTREVGLKTIEQDRKSVV